MKALLLNSGRGSRMGALTKDQPKCMTQIGGGYTIISRQLMELQRAGIEGAVITTGAHADALRAHVASLGLSLPVTFVHSPAFASTNYIVSMNLAALYLAGGDALLLHGDLVMEPGVYRDLLASPRSVMAVDETLPLPEKDFKAQLRDGRIVAVGVDRFGPDCVACQPAYRLLAPELTLWLNEIAAFVARGDTRVYAENALNALDGRLALWPLPLRGRLCAEIDNPDDLAAVSARFRPVLAAEGRANTTERAGIA